MTTTSSIFRKLSFASLLVALAVPAGLSAQTPNPDAGVSGGAAARGHGPRGEGRRGGRGHGHGHRADVMRQLDLSEAQQAQLRTIRQETRAQAEGLRERGDHDGLRALHEAARQRMEAVLTPAQRQRAESLRTQARTEHMTRRVAHLRESLGLSDAQATRVQRVFEQAAARRQATPRGGTPEARRAAHQAEREAVEQELRQILTPAQVQQLEAERANHQGRRGHRGPRGRGQGGHGAEGRGQGGGAR
ncbi:MAG: Spy/CpxP family protein refolding chaperone [Polyangiales bacterium]